MSNSLPGAYSQLPKVLAERRLNVSALHQKLKAAGITVNHKSLYRLTRPEPLQKVDMGIVGAICRACDVNISDVIVLERPEPILKKLSSSEQKRLDELMTKHSDGKLNAAELRELDELSDQAHQLTMANARLLVAQRRALDSVRLPRTVRGRRNNGKRKAAALHR